MKALLDTNAYSAFAEGDSRIARLLTSCESIALPLPVIGELLYGFRAGTRGAENEAALHRFLAEDGVGLEGIDWTVCEAYARIRTELRRLGRPIPNNDLWIAAIALRRGLVLVTRDAHFDAVPGLPVQGW